MATFMQRGNILVVLGSDIHTTPDDDYRLHLRTFLYSDAARRSPVRRGTHNFWVTYAARQRGARTRRYACEAAQDVRDGAHGQRAG